LWEESSSALQNAEARLEDAARGLERMGHVLGKRRGAEAEAEADSVDLEKKRGRFQRRRFQRRRFEVSQEQKVRERK
jgi:hypothetical protein